MILVDTSVWIDHIDHSKPIMVDLLLHDRVRDAFVCNRRNFARQFARPLYRASSFERSAARARRHA